MKKYKKENQINLQFAIINYKKSQFISSSNLIEKTNRLQITNQTDWNKNITKLVQLLNCNLRNYLFGKKFNDCNNLFFSKSMRNLNYHGKFQFQSIRKQIQLFCKNFLFVTKIFLNNKRNFRQQSGVNIFPKFYCFKIDFIQISNLLNNNFTETNFFNQQNQLKLTQVKITALKLIERLFQPVRNLVMIYPQLAQRENSGKKAKFVCSK
eukprot:TRINITY_DN13943_c0_g1_i10.p1 TRINITY_DN13943_c0_g1~~TRINITY_DN13943_c0_g1_i10.p1  ORF type:complete len:209 (+),score=-7.92 TRINITY_DN13943_c0_g1_i10:320-946(+)